MTSLFADTHRQQAGQVGCLYLSCHAVTSIPELLEHQADVSAARYYVRLIDLGFFPFVLFCADPPEPSTSRGFWERLRARFTRDNQTGQPHAPLLVAIPGATDGWLHQVAVALPVLEGEATVHISDSNFPAPFTLDWAQFLASAYACAHRVEMLGPLELDAYPPDIHAPGGPS